MRTAFVIIALSALAACKPGAERRADSPGIPPVDTLKATAPADTLPSSTTTDSAATKTPPAKTPAQTPAQKAGTKTKSTIIGRDSAFGPPKRLPQLDTVRRRPPQ